MGLKFGIVSALDPAKGLVRVKFAANENLESYWLALLQPKTLSDKDYYIPDLGEHVACLMDENCEEGVVLGALYSQSSSPPVDSQDKRHLEFSDGTFLQYDRASHVLSIHIASGELLLDCGKDVNVNIAGACVIKSAGTSSLHFAGDAVIACDGNLDIDCRQTLRLRSQLPMISYMPPTSSRVNYLPASPSEPQTPEK